jgi:hypothetical protein
MRVWSRSSECQAFGCDVSWLLRIEKQIGEISQECERAFTLVAENNSKIPGISLAFQ